MKKPKIKLQIRFAFEGHGGRPLEKFTGIIVDMYTVLPIITHMKEGIIHNPYGISEVSEYCKSFMLDGIYIDERPINHFIMESETLFNKITGREYKKLKEQLIIITDRCKFSKVRSKETNQYTISNNIYPTLKETGKREDTARQRLERKIILQLEKETDQGLEDIITRLKK